MKKTKREILFIIGTHGNESFSKSVLENLAKKFPKNKYGYDTIMGNPKALTQNIRFIDADLNRSAPGNLKSKLYEEKRAAQIINISKKYNFVIDIHGTVASSGIVTIIPYPTLQNLLLVSMFPIKKNVIWYTKSSPNKGPLVQFTKCTALEIECGPKALEQTSKTLEKNLGQFLKTRNGGNFNDLIKNLNGKEFYCVYDKLEKNNQTYKDFQLAKYKDEVFYPFMSKQYPNIACYKMKKINFENLFLK